MKYLKLLTRVNYWLIIICFFLPFVVDTCIHETLEPKAKGLKKETITENDSAKPKESTLYVKDTANIQTTDTAKSMLSASRKLYNYIISPSEDTISGIGIIIYYTALGILFIPALCFLLVIISLFFIYRKKPKYLFLAILSAINIVLLSVLLFASKTELSDFLIGFWLIYFFSFMSIVMNWMSYRLNKTNINIPNTEV